MKIEEMLRDESTIIVDVRSPMEFQGGNVAGSINLPLQEIEERWNELAGKKENIVLCCASGNRSGIAERFLRSQGMENVYNGGGWMDVNFYKNN